MSLKGPGAEVNEANEAKAADEANEAMPGLKCRPEVQAAEMPASDAGGAREATEAGEANKAKEADEAKEAMPLAEVPPEATRPMLALPA